jgi:exodeoxyribonuclease X
MFDVSKLRVVDVEGTHSDPQKCELVELAVGYVSDELDIETHSQLFKPDAPIPPEASAVNNISNRMIANQPLASRSLVTIDDLLYGEQTQEFIRDVTFIAHNAPFDYQVLDRYTSMNSNLKTHWICTYRLARQLLAPHHPNIDSYKLSYLRYYLDLDVSDDLVLHRADADVLICWKLFLRLLEMALEEGKISGVRPIVPQIVELCWKPIPIAVWPFGKHKGAALDAIPLDYFTWALNNMSSLNEKSTDFDADLAASVVAEVEKRLA